MSSKADVLRAESQVKSTALFLERSNTGVLLSTERLRMMMKDHQTPKYEIGENVIADLGPSNLPPFENAYAKALANRPELAALAAAEEAQREQASLAKGANLPRLDGQANLTYANPNQRYIPPDDVFHMTWDASLILSWTPTAIFGATASAKGSEARAAELAAKQAALREALRLEIRSALQAVKEEEFAIVASEQGLAAAEEGYRVRRELYRSGRATLVEVTDSETELTRARLEAVNAHIDYRIALANLKYALGDEVVKPKSAEAKR
jgi:outer membrane protein TolC